MNEANKKRSARYVAVGLVAAIGLFYSGVTFAASPPSSINTCTKVTKKGVVGKTKVTTASSCTGTSIFQTYSDAADSDPIVAGHHDGGVFFNSSGTAIATLTIPTAGNYAVSATMLVTNNSGLSTYDGCALEGPTVANLDLLDTPLLPPGPSTATLALEIVDTFSAGGTVSVFCVSGPAPSGTQEATTTRIIATPGTSLTNSAL